MDHLIFNVNLSFTIKRRDFCLKDKSFNQKSLNLNPNLDGQKKTLSASMHFDFYTIISAIVLSQLIQKEAF